MLTNAVPVCPYVPATVVDEHNRVRVPRNAGAKDSSDLQKHSEDVVICAEVYLNLASVPAGRESCPDP